MRFIRLKNILALLILTAGLELGLTALPGHAAALSYLWEKATEAYLDKNYAKSLEFLEKYLERAQDADQIATARFFQAELHRAKGEDERAAPLYQTLAISAPSGPLKISARYREGELAYNRGDYAKALGIFAGLAGNSAADFLFPQLPLAQVKCSLKLQRLDEARKVFGRLLDAYPRSLLDPEIKFLYGIMKEYQGNAIDALKIYEELNENPLARLFSGGILEAQGRYLEAISAYNATLEIADQAAHRQMASYYKLRAFYKSGDLLSTERLCDVFLTAYPQSLFRPKVALTKLLVLNGQGRFAAVLESYPALTAALAGLEAVDRSLLHFTLGEAMLNLGRYPEAAAQYQQALPNAGTNRPDVLLKLSYAQLAVADWEGCYRTINEYLRTAPRPQALGYALAIRANLETGREANAFHLAQTLVQSQAPQAELGLYFLAVYYQARGDSGKLVSQWAILEKGTAAAAPDVEYREAAAWSRLLVSEAHFREGNYPLARRYAEEALKLFPHGQLESWVYASLTWCAFQEQDYPGVKAAADRCLAGKNVPPAITTEISLLQAHAAFNLQEYADAIAAYRRWLQGAPAGHPAIPGVRFQLGWAHYLNRSYLDAIDAWKEMVKDYPDDPQSQEALFWIADTYFQAGENRQARAVYQDLIARFPASARLAAFDLRVAQTYYNEQQNDEAIRRFTAMMVTYPGTPEAEEARQGIEAASYRIADELNTIPAFREFIVRFPESKLAEDIQYRIGEAYYFKEKYQESLAEFLQFVVVYTKSPRTPNAQYYIAVCQEQLGNTQDAVLQAQAFVVNYPQHELAPEMMFRLASGEFQLEKYTAAAEHFVACAEQYALKEYQPRAWYNAAVTYEKLQLPAQAVIYYEKLVRAYPQDPNSEVSMSRLVVLQAMQDNAEGVETALQAMEARGDRELLQKTWLNLAVIYQEQGKVEAYQNMLGKIMRQGLPKTKEYSAALVELAASYEGQKDWPSALEVYRRLAETTAEKKWREAAQKRIKLLQRIIKAAP